MRQSVTPKGTFCISWTSSAWEREFLASASTGNIRVCIDLISTTHTQSITQSSFVPLKGDEPPHVWQLSFRMSRAGTKCHKMIVWICVGIFITVPSSWHQMIRDYNISNKHFSTFLHVRENVCVSVQDIRSPRQCLVSVQQTKDSRETSERFPLLYIWSEHCRINPYTLFIFCDS